MGIKSKLFSLLVVGVVSITQLPYTIYADETTNNETETDTQLEQAQKNLSEFETKYATEISRLSTGIQGYYESINCEHAVNIIKNPEGETAGYTNIGIEGDATTLSNVKDTIQHLKKCNELRVANGLNIPWWQSH